MAKIYYITNLKLPTEKAHGYQIVKTCEALAKKGAEVKLVMPLRESHIREDIFDFYGVKRVFAAEYLRGFDFRKWERWLGGVWFWMHKRSFRWRVRKWARDKEGIFYTREDEIADELTKMGKQVFYEAHNKPRWWRLHLRLVRGVKGIVAISKGLKDEYTRAGWPGEKIIVAADAVDLEEFDPPVGGRNSKLEIRNQLGLPVDRKIAVYVGSWHKWKGVDVLIEAASKLDSVLFVLVGGISSFKVKGNNILLVGQKDRKEVPKWMAAADVLVLPNSGREDISRFYTSPLKMFEYMAAGRPIVASDLPSIREVLSEETAVLVEPDDAGALAAGIRKVFEDEEGLAVRIAERAKKEVEKYTWESRVKIILNFIHEREN